MIVSSEAPQNTDEFLAHVRPHVSRRPCAEGEVGLARAPAVADVMGGIAEDSGGLVLTAALPASYCAAAWRIASSGLHVVLAGARREATAASIELSPSRVNAAPPDEGEEDPLLNEVRAADAESLLPACLAVRKCIQSGLIEPLSTGLCVVLRTCFPDDVDFGRPAVQAAAVVDALMRAAGRPCDRIQQARIAASAVAGIVGGGAVRTALTSLAAPANGALLQTQFHPVLQYEARELPPGIVIAAVRTRLERATTFDRIVETRICTEMGRRWIAELQRTDGAADAQAGGPLSTISPTEYVDRFRDRIPTKIAGKTFIARFGSLRGANGELQPNGTYKIRSRAEHHIYENRRAHEFAAGIVRARRTGDLAELIGVGELMYASHWSHSQRCGIGGVETDQFVTCIRQRGSAHGLFGAKVTGGGGGGEMVVLMRNDEQGRAALADAVAEAESLSKRTIRVLSGFLPGAEHYSAKWPAQEIATAAGA